jgi:excisionase family DNA binding protein
MAGAGTSSRSRAALPRAEIAVQRRKDNGNRACQESRSWITTNQAAKILDRTPRRVGQLVDEGVLPAIKEGGRWMLDEADVVRLARLRDAYERSLGEVCDG